MKSFDEIRNLLSKYSPAKLALGLALVLLPVFVLIFLVAGSESYKVLFSELTEKEYSEVIRTLEEKNVDYQADEKSGSVFVTESDVHDVRMQLMTEGVLSNTNVGFEIFDNSEFGMTEFSQKINYQRALQGELSRTISSLDEIKYARVHIVQPANKLFRTESDKSTASVTLFIKSGMSVESSQIRGIQNIVSASVDDLIASDVVVSDQRGVILSTEYKKDEAAHESKLSRKEELEKYYSGKVNDILSAAFGENSYVVSVNVELDYTKSIKIEEQFVNDADNKQVLKRKRISKNKSGKTISSDTEYEVGKKVINTEEEIGRIKRINIGVMVPGSTDNETVSKLREIIEMAGGVDLQRGDKVTVHASSLALEEEVVAAEQAVTHKLVEIEQVNNVSPTNQDNNDSETNQTIITGISQKLKLSETPLLIGISVILLLSVILNILILIRKKKNSARLSEDERQKVLSEMTNWFEQGHQRNA